jgi:hypothetical protein
MIPPTTSNYTYVRFEVFKVVTMKNAVFWDIENRCTSEETHYVSATELILLILCTIWGFHGGDMKNAVFWDIRT